MEYTDYQESVDRDFEKATNQTENNSLGSVDMGRFAANIPGDPETERLKSLSGYIEFNLENLPSKGLFYRDDFKIYIRSARVQEIRDYSMIDETNINDADEKLNNILSACTKIVYGDMPGTYKDILEEDRLYLLIAIRELTFKNGESKLMMPVSKKCPCGDCADSYELKTSNIQCNEPDETIASYYDSELKAFRVTTKNYGEIVLAPPTIGVMRALTSWGRKKEENHQKWDKSLIQIIPYVTREWRGFDDKKIMALATNISGWDMKKYSLVYRLIEMMKIGMKPEFTYQCEKCGGEVTVPLSFPGGLRDLFIISDITSELL